MAMILVGVDDGKTLLMESGRSHPDYRKSGVVAAVFRAAFISAYQRFHEWQYYRASSVQREFIETHRDNITILMTRVRHFNLLLQRFALFHGGFHKDVHPSAFPR